MNVVTNPLYDEQIVSAAPENLACRDKRVF